MAESGVELLQYRNKQAGSRHLFEICSSLSARLSAFSRTNQRQVRFVVNDRADIALLSRSGGVHVGQNDLDVEAARAIVGPEAWVGVSTHNLEQVDAADKTSADYIAFGPIFPTTTKDQPDPVVGLNGLAEARKRTRKPIVAIGGITLDRAADTYAAGADSLAVARDIAAVADPGARAREFLRKAARARQHPEPQIVSENGRRSGDV